MVVDYYSKYPEVYFLGNQDLTRQCISKTSALDNGQQFSNEKFRQFLKDWLIQYDPATPIDLNSDGMAESATKIVKDCSRKHTKLMKIHTKHC